MNLMNLISVLAEVTGEIGGGWGSHAADGVSGVGCMVCLWRRVWLCSRMRPRLATPQWIVAKKRRRAEVVRVPSFQPLSTKNRVDLEVTASIDVNDPVLDPGPFFGGEGTNQQGAHGAPPPARQTRR